MPAEARWGHQIPWSWSPGSYEWSPRCGCLAIAACTLTAHLSSFPFECLKLRDWPTSPLGGLWGSNSVPYPLWQCAFWKAPVYPHKHRPRTAKFHFCFSIKLNLVWESIAEASSPHRIKPSCPGGGTCLHQVCPVVSWCFIKMFRIFLWKFLIITRFLYHYKSVSNIFHLWLLILTTINTQKFLFSSHINYCLQSVS